jgi:hypothetical protein
MPRLNVHVLAGQACRVKWVKYGTSQPPVCCLCRLLANLYNGNVYLWNYNDSVSGLCSLNLANSSRDMGSALRLPCTVVQPPRKSTAYDRPWSLPACALNIKKLIKHPQQTQTQLLCAVQSSCQFLLHRSVQLWLCSSPCWHIGLVCFAVPTRLPYVLFPPFSCICRRWSSPLRSQTCQVGTARQPTVRCAVQQSDRVTQSQPCVTSHTKPAPRVQHEHAASSCRKCRIT